VLRACVAVGVAVALFFSAVILVDLKSARNVGFFGLFVASGIAYYALRARQLRTRGVDPAMLLHRADWTGS
jgi:hypothetical protein